ncbi:MAG: pilus assembly protein PilM, partial [Gammaproteobacteria bacterium]|nr:pilus assembly protein PilM [Gammaproteobacteria bacterium]
ELSASRWINGHREELARVPRPRADGAGQPTVAATDQSGFSALARSIDLDATTIVVRVPPEEVLTRTVTLPSAAAENLRQVLGFEMHRQTPFAADQVYFHYRPLEQRPGSGKISVQLSVTRREVVDQVLRLLPGWNLSVAGSAMIPGIDDDGLLLKLSPPISTDSSSHIPVKLLWAINAALLLVVIAVPFVQQTHAIDGLRARVAVAKSDAEAVAEIRERAERLRVNRRFLIDKKRDHPAAITVLAALTAALPDTTWVQRVEVDAKRVRLRGTSTTASSLIPILEDSPMFRRVTFDAPVTRNPATGKEQFQLIFEIAPPGDTNEKRNDQDLQQSAGSLAASAGFHRRR